MTAEPLLTQRSFGRLSAVCGECLVRKPSRSRLSEVGLAIRSDCLPPGLPSFTLRIGHLLDGNPYRSKSVSEQTTVVSESRRRFLRTSALTVAALPVSSTLVGACSEGPPAARAQAAAQNADTLNSTPPPLRHNRLPPGRRPTPWTPCTRRAPRRSRRRQPSWATNCWHRGSSVESRCTILRLRS